MTSATALPRGYPHAHASDEARRLAEQGMVFRAQVGSGVHGTAVAGSDDRDEMGICLEPPEYVTGLSRVPRGTGATTATVRFEQYERHTAWDLPGGLSRRSGAGDLDVVIYTARKWCRLALDGNPTVLLLLFVPESETVYCSAAGEELRTNASAFLSRRVADRFLGYLESQRRGMLGLARTNRPELVAHYGYDTKYAMHAVRLGLQGIELLSTGTLSLPVREPDLSVLRAVRAGQYSRDDVVDMVADVTERLRAAAESSDLPAEPNLTWVNDWLHRHHLAYWRTL